MSYLKEIKVTCCRTDYTGDDSHAYILSCILFCKLNGSNNLTENVHSKTSQKPAKEAMRDRVKADDGKCLLFFLFSSSPLQVFAHKKKKSFLFHNKQRGEQNEV